MEALVGLVLTIGAIILLNIAVSAGARTIKAAARSAVGKGTFAENMELAFKGMGPMEVRFADERLGENNEGPLAKRIEVKGLLPVRAPVRAAFVTSVFDNTSGTYEPVISALEGFQEP